MDKHSLKKYKDMSDEKLALAAKTDDLAFSELFARFLFVVRSCAYGYLDVGLDFDDLVQEGVIGLMYAVKGYDPESYTAFSPFARLCINRSIISAVRTALRKKRIPPSMMVLLDNEIPSDSGNEPEQMLIARENIDRLYSQIEENLTGFEQNVLSHYLHGKSYKQIADLLLCDKKSVDNAIQRVRKKLKNG